MRFYTSLGILYLSFLVACKKDDRRDIRDFYFPVEDLRRGQVYEYDLAQGDSSSPEYWYFRTFQRDSGVFLAGTYYDSRFQIGQIIRQKVSEEGIFAREYSIYDPDFETGKQIQTTAVIESPDVYPFRVQDSVGVSVFSLHYQPATDPSTTIYLTRKRLFLGDAPDFEFQGDTYSCVRFGLLESVGTKKGGDDMLKGRGEEWYAKGLGLVYYKKTFGGKKSRVEFAYRLKDVFPMSELEKKAAAYFGE
jgi:hypothetical protein